MHYIASVNALYCVGKIDVMRGLFQHFSICAISDTLTAFHAFLLTFRQCEARHSTPDIPKYPMANYA